MYRTYCRFVKFKSVAKIQTFYDYKQIIAMFL